MTKPSNTFWTEERDEQLKAILARIPIPSTREIMHEMGAATRSTIIGKCHREGWVLAPQGKCTPLRKRKPKHVRRQKLYVPRPTINLPVKFIAGEAEDRRDKARATSIAIAERRVEDMQAAKHGIGFFAIRDGRCRWPMTDVQPLSDFRFCGVKCDGVYCAHHTRRSLSRFRAEAAE